MQQRYWVHRTFHEFPFFFSIFDFIFGNDDKQQHLAFSEFLFSFLVLQAFNANKSLAGEPNTSE